MSQQQSTINSRLIYENAKLMLSNAGVSVETSKLTQSFLRLENQMLVGKTQWQFPFLSTQPNFSGIIFNTEQRLNQQDSFVIASWGLFWSNPIANNDPTAILHSYPNILVFGAAPAAAAETIYASYFQLAVNNDIILPAWDALRHRMVAQTQGLVVSPGAQDQIDMAQDGFYPVEPNLVAIGSKNSVLNLLMPAALAAVTAFERLTIIFRGVLAQNSTIIT
jgi:hypothetical protein